MCWVTIVCSSLLFRSCMSFISTRIMNTPYIILLKNNPEKSLSCLLSGVASQKPLLLRPNILQRPPNPAR